ncbi:MAG: aldose 1-epimerase [Ginsengibacter sp.]
MFSIHKKIENGFDKIILQDDLLGTSAEIIPACSAILHAFSVKNNGDTVNVIESYSSLEDFKENVTEKGFRGCKLSPFVCRLYNGTYTFGGTEYHIQKSLPAKHSLHGILYDKAFEVTAQHIDEEGASVTMKHSYNGEDAGYPFKYDCVVTWKLESENKLSVTTECINKDEGLIQIQDGWHPYFTLGDSIDDLYLEFQSMEKLEFNDELIPTGKLFEYDTFNSLQKMGTTFLDNCFTLNLETCQPMCVLRSNEKNIQVEFHPTPSYPYLQIYTPPNRKSIAIENISGAPDGFNNKIGIQTLEHCQSALFKTTYKITLLNKNHD